MTFDPAEAEAAQRRSWTRNALAWTQAVRGTTIASRREVTNAAILDVLTDLGPKTALDVGCGEGWLTRALTAAGTEAWGVDACPELIGLAEAEGQGRFSVVAIDKLAELAPVRDVDVVVANFAFTTQASVPQGLGAAAQLLRPGGHVVVQTVHPAVIAGPYVSGWRRGSWEGFGPEFVDPAPWYFRTVGDWLHEVRAAGLSLVAVREPIGADSRPRSLLITAQRAR